MKKIVLCWISLLAVALLQAQVNISSVTMTVNGNENLKLVMDGNNYNLANSTIKGNKTTIGFSNISTGQHNFQVTRTPQNHVKTERINSSFTLRTGYNMHIKVKPDGSLEFSETKITGVVTNRVPMSNSAFTVLLQNVRNQRTTVGKRTVITNAFNNTANFFSSTQAAQLIQLVNSESYRLNLAKLSYRSITDREHFYLVYDLLNSQASKDELQDYIDDSYEDYDYHVAMSDADFNALYQSIQQQRPASSQVNSLTSAFNNTSNYFTSYQVRQLIQLVYGEATRLQLAKLSYRSITDPVNFNQLNNLFSRQASIDELAAYVDNYNDGGNTTVAMPDVDFNALYRTIQQQYPVSAQMNSLTNAFNNTNNYFTTQQASQLIRLVNSDGKRLPLAKLSYRSITDRENFSQVFNLLSYQSSKDELTTYINSYYAGGNTHMAMSDADFTELYQATQAKFFPNEKLNSLTGIFNNTANYFTCAQAKLLIALVSFESNRLQLAKLSYPRVTDRANFSQLYDLLDSQASRNELDAYVKAYHD